jgi:CRP-like cAMP-binding protein
MLYTEEVKKLINLQFEKRFMQGELLYEQGMTCQYFYIITKGTLFESNNRLGKGLFVPRLHREEGDRVYPLVCQRPHSKWQVSVHLPGSH